MRMTWVPGRSNMKATFSRSAPSSSACGKKWMAAFKNLTFIWSNSLRLAFPSRSDQISFPRIWGLIFFTMILNSSGYPWNFKLKYINILRKPLAEFLQESNRVHNDSKRSRYHHSDIWDIITAICEISSQGYLRYLNFKTPMRGLSCLRIYP